MFRGVRCAGSRAQPVPGGLQPGDHYHLIYATSFQTDIDTDTTVPPATPFFGGLAAADYTVTYTAWAGGMLPDWNFADITWHAVLSTNGHNAKDRISIQGPIYNTHGDLIANDANDLWDGSIANPLGYDEVGQLITSDFRVWSGTLQDGTWSTNGSCGDWNDPREVAVFGVTNVSDGKWIKSNFAVTGHDAYRLYGVSPLLTVPQPGDFNGNGTADAADYVVWRHRNGSAADYDLWRSHFGQSLPNAAAAAQNAPVPEPPTFTLPVALVMFIKPRPVVAGLARRR